MKLNILRGKIAWFGKHSGYEPLTDYFPHKIDLNIITGGTSFIGRLIGKALQVIFKWERKNPQDSFSELKLLKKTNDNTISHILYGEGHIDLLSKTPEKKLKNLVATIHLPMSQWNEQQLVYLKKLEHAIILYKEEIPLFAKYIPLHKMHLIQLGISTDFFKPGLNKDIKKNKVLVIGHFLRNFDMLLKVYERISNKDVNKLEFHVIIPAKFRNIPELIKMAKQQNVFFHQNLSDQELLEQYQDSYVLLIPMNDSGANTAIVQALACGLPVITTDVGGIRSYGGGDIFPLVDNNDAGGMVSLFDKYYSNVAFRDQVSKKQREFAVEYLEWKIIAQQHLNLYESILAN